LAGTNGRLNLALHELFVRVGVPVVVNRNIGLFSLLELGSVFLILFEKLTEVLALCFSHHLIKLGSVLLVLRYCNWSRIFENTKGDHRCKAYSTWAT